MQLMIPYHWIQCNAFCQWVQNRRTRTHASSLRHQESRPIKVFVTSTQYNALRIIMDIAYINSSQSIVRQFWCDLRAFAHSFMSISSAAEEWNANDETIGRLAQWESKRDIETKLTRPMRVYVFVWWNATTIDGYRHNNTPEIIVMVVECLHFAVVFFGWRTKVNYHLHTDKKRTRIL